MPARPQFPAFWFRILLLAALAVPALPSRPATAQEETPLIESATPEDRLAAPKRKRPGWILHRARKDAAATQLAYAKRFEAKGRLRKAAKAYNALVHRWHDTPEAAEAQHHLADIQVRRGKIEDAFEEYQYLLRYFPGTAPYQEVLENQFKLANDARTARHWRFFILPGVEDPGRAVPMFEQLVDNGPNWDRAPEAQYTVGSIQEATGELELAVVAYETLQLRYPRSGYSEEAAYRRTVTLGKLSDHNPRDEEQCREALSAALSFSRHFPAHPELDGIRELGERLKLRLADMYYDRALYYDRIAKRPQSAIIAYSDFISKFPTSDRRATADERVATLQLQLEGKHEK